MENKWQWVAVEGLEVFLVLAIMALVIWGQQLQDSWLYYT